MIFNINFHKLASLSKSPVKKLIVILIIITIPITYLFVSADLLKK